jgi:hypothetical protein
MSPKTKFESVQKRDASEFIPSVERLGLKNVKNNRRAFKGRVGHP